MKNIHYINAGAGSGKTYTLTKTLVKLIGEGRCKPSEVILTTFTELAASEFRQKAYDALVRAKRFDKASELTSATIGTVHSVALKYVQKYWYILGLGSTMNVLSEEDKKVFVSEAVARAIEPEDRLVFKSFNETFTRKGYRTDQPWVDLLKSMIEKADTFGITDLERSRTRSLEFISTFFNGENTELDSEALHRWLKAYRAICKEGDKEGVPYSEEMQKIDKCLEDSSSYAARTDILATMERPKRAAAKKEPDYDGVLAALRASLQDRSFMEPLATCINTVYALAAKVNREFDEYKTTNGLIEFNDMERYFIRLLDNDLVRADIRSSVKFVFVDEFQDSSPIQIEIFRKLSDLVEHSYWVGDPKQSIYGFRGSAPEVVMDITRQIRKGGEGFSYENLPFSYRSGEDIVSFDSAVARILFTDPERYPDPELKHAPEHGNDFNATDAVQHWNCVDGITAETLSQKLIDVLRTTDLQPKDIAILCRKNEDVAATASWLKRFGLPVSSPEVFLASKAETQLVFAILKYMLFKDDHTKAELAMLIDDAALEDIVIDKDRIIADFDASRLMEVTDRVRHQGVPDIVDTIIDELDLRGLCAKWGDSLNRQANLDVLQMQAREYDAHCVQLGIGSSLQGYITYVSQLEIPPKANNSDNGIKVLTYHGSKGLEWRMVILMDLKKDLLRESVLKPRFVYGLNIDSVDGDLFLRFIPDFRPTERNGVPAFIMDQPAVKSGFEAYREKCAEENKRLLYVGFTRARDYLVTLSYPGDKFSWLAGSGLTPASLKDLQKDSATCIWDRSVPASHILEIYGTEHETYKAESDTGIWYRPVADHKDRPRKYITPSSLTEGVTSCKSDPVKVSGGITLEGSYDPRTLGTCIHNFFAVCSSGADCSGKAARLLKNFGLQDVIKDPESLNESYQKLHSYLESTFGTPVFVWHELLYSQKLTSGQTVTGEMDLVWETAEKHCIIVDYKNSHADTDYGPQLHLYRKALESAGFTVDGTFLFYALQGDLVRVDTSDKTDGDTN